MSLPQQHQATAPAFARANHSVADFRRMVDKIPTLAWSCWPDGTTEFLNQRWLDYTGLVLEEALGWGWKVPIHPDDLPRFMETWARLITSGEAGEEEARLRRFDGDYRWFLFRAVPVRDEHGKLIRWYGTNTDIEDRKRAEFLLAAETRTLEMVARGASVAAILDDLCSTIDAQGSGIISSVLLMDGDRKSLRPVSGARLPRAWADAIDPVEIGPRVGSCGTAAFLKKQIIASDIANDPLWVNFRDAALRNGLGAAWSQPLISKNGEVLGTFCIYYPTPRRPSAGDLDLMERAAHVALIAVEGGRSRAELTKALDEVRKSEDQLRNIIDAIPALISVIATDVKVLYANRSTLEYTGVTSAETKAHDFGVRVIHPDDFATVQANLRERFAQGVPFQMEFRVRRSDGQYRWFVTLYNPLCDEQGQVLRWYATATDIDERKQAEERVRSENLALREEVDRSSMFEEIVGSSAPLRKVLTQVAKVAPSDSTVLILGETGTGKELIARAIHKRSNRANRAFIRVNCAAIPPSLIASELFGHEKGAFTGATQRRLGRFELADSGTIFLDEIGELPTETQIALLRVLQEREFERVGSGRPISVDVRVIAATNRDLKAAVDGGAFRLDLFYRLNVFPLQVPSLRERADDIPVLVEYLTERYAKTAGKRIRNISKHTLDLFQTYDWPGNVRELQNVVERAVILCDGETFTVDETWLKRETPQAPGPAVPFVAAIANREKEMIEAVLAECRGRVSGPTGAAAKLGIPRQTLDSKIASLHIDKYLFKTR